MYGIVLYNTTSGREGEVEDEVGVEEDKNDRERERERKGRKGKGVLVGCVSYDVVVVMVGGPLCGCLSACLSSR